MALVMVLAVLTALAALESNLPSCCSSCKMQDQEATMTVLAVSAGLVMTATPLNSTPPPPWAREIGTICPFGFFPQFYCIFWPNLDVARPVVVL